MHMVNKEQTLVDKKRMVRRIGYDFSALESDEIKQMDFFTDIEKENKGKKLMNMVLNIKDKYGKNALLRGIDFDARATQRERNEQIGGHKSRED